MIDKNIIDNPDKICTLTKKIIDLKQHGWLPDKKAFFFQFSDLDTVMDIMAITKTIQIQTFHLLIQVFLVEY